MTPVATIGGKVMVYDGKVVTECPDGGGAGTPLADCAAVVAAIGSCATSYVVYIEDLQFDTPDLSGDTLIESPAPTGSVIALPGDIASSYWNNDCIENQSTGTPTECDDEDIEITIGGSTTFSDIVKVTIQISCVVSNTIFGDTDPHYTLRITLTNTLGTITYGNSVRGISAPITDTDYCIDGLDFTGAGSIAVTGPFQSANVLDFGTQVIA